MIRRNVGGLDRAVRLVLGAVLLTTGLVLVSSGGGHGWLPTIVGALVLTTGALGYCPPYALFGLSTARSRRPAAPCPRGEESGSP